MAGHGNPANNDRQPKDALTINRTARSILRHKVSDSGCVSKELSMFKSRLLSLAAFAIVFTLQTAVAQVTTGSISGTVKDESGAVMPAVAVTVKHVDTGRVRNVMSDGQGRYSFPDLDLGSYEVGAELPGFQNTVRSGITLTVGRQAVVDLLMKVGEVSQRVVVEGEAPLVETTSATVAGLVDDKKVRDLPLNGRGFTQLALMQPGVLTTGGSAAGAQPGNEGQKLSISGTRTTQTAFLIDGTDIRNQWGATPGSASGLVLGVETIREFSVITSNASAEYGGFAGGVINAVTRSGTNQIHGSVFEFLRNSALDARNFFDIPTIKPFRRNQFGFALGGPVKKDKTFFFGSYEGLRQQLMQTSIITVPDEAAHRGILPAAQGGNVGVASGVKPFLDLYPLPNLQTFTDGTGQYQYADDQPTNENYYAIKVDHQLTDKDSLFVRYTADKGDRSSLSTIPVWTETVYNLNQYVTLNEKRIFSGSLLNEFQFALNRTAFHGNVDSKVDPALKFIPTPDRTFGRTSGGGIAGWGPSPNTPRQDALNRYDVADTLIYSTGRHELKAGFRWIRIQFNTLNTFRVEGQYNFGSLAGFLTGAPTLFSGVVTPLIHSGIRENMPSAFIQDNFKVTSNLTLNIGLRYEPTGDIVEVAGRISNLDNLNGTELRSGNPWFKNNPAWKNLGPRFGFAWDPFSDGKTSVRGGFGIFYDLFSVPTYQGAAQYNPPYFVQVNLAPTPGRPVPFPNAYSTLDIKNLPSVTPGLWVVPIDNSHQPYVMQESLTIQRQVLPSTVVMLGYFRTSGVHLSFMNDANLAVPQVVNDRWFYPANATRPNPVFGQVRVFDFNGNSNYNSFRLSVLRRFQKGFQVQTSYSWSRAIDNSSNNTAIDSATTANGVSESGFDRNYDRGLSGFDVRHVFTTNMGYELPFGSGKRFLSGASGIAGKLVSGWQFTSIVSVQTGRPANAVLGFNRSRSQAAQDLAGRPDLAPGASNNPVLGGPDKYFDPAAFVLQPAGFIGNVGRNTIIGPGSATLDFGLSKETALGEGKSLQFRAESFNALNRPNFSQPNQTIFSNATGIPSATAGRITSTSTTSRQIQFALKVIF
jgi:hypothetical protein